MSLKKSLTEFSAKIDETFQSTDNKPP